MDDARNPYPLPSVPRLGVDRLVGTFRSTTNSYKFLWFLALVEELSDRKLRGESLRLEVRAVLARMLGLAWLPIRRFRLSFGRQDRIGAILEQVADRTSLTPIQPRRTTDAGIRTFLAANEAICAELARYVPYRFLSPWFGSELRGERDSRRNDRIREGSAQSFHVRESPPVYRFRGENDREIEIHPAWACYLTRYARIVAGYTRWELLRYLERRNPGVPNIAGKLEPSGRRDLAGPRRLWRAVLEAEGGVRCIYTGERVGPSDFSLDHFVPFSFVAHDLLWNLVPVSREVNSRKGDFLPDLGRHLPGLAHVQHRALHRWRTRREAIEQYVDAFRRPHGRIEAWTPTEFERGLESVLAPLLETARNQGFEPWVAAG